MNRRQRARPMFFSAASSSTATPGCTCGNEDGTVSDEHALRLRRKSLESETSLSALVPVLCDACNRNSFPVCCIPLVVVERKRPPPEKVT